MNVLAKERKEMKEVFQRENAQLRKESAELRKEDTKLHAQVDRQNQEIAKLRKMLRQAESKVKKSIRQR